MIDWVINSIIWFQWNGVLAIGLYWVPLSVCVYGYTVRTFKRYLEDKKDRETVGSYYHPKETVGTLIGRALVTIIPVANLWAAMFDVGPKLFANFFRAIGRIFDQPLVPDTEHYMKLREKTKSTRTSPL